MKYLITERQLNLIKEEKILKIYFDVFNNDWNLLQKFLERRGNPLYYLIGDVDLRSSHIKTLGELVGIEGNLNAYKSNLESLGKLKHVSGDIHLQFTNVNTLGNLEYVGKDLDLMYSKVWSLGNLQYVGGDLHLSSAPVSSVLEYEQLLNQIEVGGDILL